MATDNKEDKPDRRADKDIAELGPIADAIRNLSAKIREERSKQRVSHILIDRSAVVDATQLPFQYLEDLIEYHSDKLELSMEDREEAITKGNLRAIPCFDVLDQWLKYNGIIGFSSEIWQLMTLLTKTTR